MQQAAGDALNIEFVNAVLSEAEWQGLYAQADALISLHRSEGLGLVIAEAMMHGLPVIATDWSANHEFLTSNTGFPIGYNLVPVVEDQGHYSTPGAVWADPDIDAAAEALQRLRADPDLCVRLGQAAAAHAAETFSPERYAREFSRLVLDGQSPTSPIRS